MDKFKMQRLADSIRTDLREAGVPDAEIEQRPDDDQMTIGVPFKQWNTVQAALGLPSRPYREAWEFEGEVVEVEMRPLDQELGPLFRREEEVADRIEAAGFAYPVDVGSCFENDNLEVGEFQIEFAVPFPQFEAQKLTHWQHQIAQVLPEMWVVHDALVDENWTEEIPRKTLGDGTVQLPYAEICVQIVFRERGGAYSLPT